MENNEENAKNGIIEEDSVKIEDPKAVLSALERAKNDAKKFREQTESLEKALKEKDESVARYSNNLIKEKVTQKINQEGIKDSERLLKFIDFDNIQLDDDLNIIGFEDQIEKLKSDLPEIFDAKLRVGGQADAAVKAAVSTQFSASQLQAAKILGKI